MKIDFLSHYHGLNETEDRIYRNFNIFLFLGLFDILIIGSALINTEPSWPFYMCVLQFIFFILLLILHTRGLFLVSRFITFLLTIGLQALACITHGESAGFDLLFFIIGVLPMLFINQKRFYIPLFILTVATHLTIRYSYVHFEPIIVIDTTFPLYWNVFITAFLIFLVIHLFKQGYQKSQQFLQEQNQLVLHQKKEIEGINNNLESLVLERTLKVIDHEKLFIEFANINAHRVRGPLARILGLMNLVDLEPDRRDAVLKETFPLIRQNAEELSAVLKEVDNMLNSTSLYLDSRNKL